VRASRVGMRRAWKCAVGWVEPRLVAARPTARAMAILRGVVARSFSVTVYEPRDTAAWIDAAGRFAALVPA
jgi:hypothetical protein